ncbi:uncharacterized protein LOC131695902 [Topomyia yanbarensis]|uniref:uncharacterized protein LOC131695902 n=1 Tax=Topomyia yanbarensis TaxID=2498891 RepID=UPI00273CE63F|nr:uncharacterized protein LOC131695902 [Topomyia yanbarensis]
MFFVSRITKKYDDETGKLTRELLKTAVKMARMKNRLKFLLNCRKCKLVPKCLCYKVGVSLHSSISRQEMKILEHRQKIRIISLVVRDTKRLLEQLKNRKRHLYEKVQWTLEESDWRAVRAMVEKKAANVYNSTKRTEINKLSNLKRKKIEETCQQPEWIENKTNHEIPDYLERTLLLGPNFNIQSKSSIPYVRLVADVETSIKSKPQADDIRAEVSTIISNYVNYQNQPRTKENDWIHKDIVRSRKFLRENPDIYVIKADKGNKTVLMSGTEYHEKMTTMVNDASTYKQRKDNPSNRVLKMLNSIIEQWWLDQHIDRATKHKLKMYNCTPPRIYGLPKIHKENCPLRPVISTIGSATYHMAQYLSGILNNLVGKTEYHVRNSFEFAKEISKIRVPEGCVMYSLDVVSLYTNIPVNKVYEYVEERWNEVAQTTTIPWDSFKQAMKTVLEASFFQYDGKFYDQIFGVPMGSPLSPVVANIVMEKLEGEALEGLKQKGISLIVYQRYVDDYFLVGKENEIETVIEEFNEQHTSIKFTVEKESNESIRFLDLLLSRNGEKIDKKWLPKQKTGRYLDYTSESPYTHKKNTAIALMDRALKLTDANKREESITEASNILRANNYPEHIIKSVLKQRVDILYNTLQTRSADEQTAKYISIPYIPCLSEKIGKVLRKNNLNAAYKPNDKIKNTIFTMLKDKIPKMQQTNVVYSIPCGGCTNKEYIGQTSQTLEKRISQHKNSIRTSTSITGLTQHTRECGHHFNFNETRILERINHESNRLTAEVLHIKLREQRAVNLQRDAASFACTYNGLLNKLRSARNGTGEKEERRHQ